MFIVKHCSYPFLLARIIMNFDNNLNRDLLKIECKIKKEIQKYTLNNSTKKQIARYTDRYNESKLSKKDKIKNLVYHEILPKELQDALLKHKIVVEKDVDVEVNEISVSEEVESNEGDNDYNTNYHEEDDADEFVDEENGDDENEYDL